jgi:hypothetical protein
MLVRLPSATHTTDADMRAVELPFSQSGTTLSVDASGVSANVAPPGYYYLFVNTGSNSPPSKARIVHVGATPQGGTAPAPFGA